MLFRNIDDSSSLKSSSDKINIKTIEKKNTTSIHKKNHLVSSSFEGHTVENTRFVNILPMLFFSLGILLVVALTH